MKKVTVSLLLCVLMAFSAGCGSRTSGETQSLPDGSVFSDTAAEHQEIGLPTEQQKETEASEEQTEYFQMDAELESCVIYDAKDIRITVEELIYHDDNAEFILVIENHSAENLTFRSGSMYTHSTVNGYMMQDGYMHCDVAAGKKGRDSIAIEYGEFLICGIRHISEVTFNFEIEDESYDSFYTGPCIMKTSAYDAYDPEEETYQNMIQSNDAAKRFQFQLDWFSAEELYHKNDIHLCSSALIRFGNFSPVLLLEMENTGTVPAVVELSDMMLNGLALCSSEWQLLFSDWARVQIDAGKRILIQCPTDEILEKDRWSVYGIEEIASVGFGITLENLEGEDVTETQNVTWAIKDPVPPFDRTGTELYHKNGLRIIEKTLMQDTSLFGGDCILYLLAENTGDKVYTVDEVFESLSVNDYMTDASFYETEVHPGMCSLMTVKIAQSSLEENGISSLDEIEKIEFTLEIQDGHHLVDKPLCTVVRSGE